MLTQHKRPLIKAIIALGINLLRIHQSFINPKKAEVFRKKWRIRYQ